ncbi:unnamed protein product, partial [Staurois parvus]
CPSVPWCVPPQPVSPAALYSRRPGIFSVGTGCDSLRLHSRVPTEHVRVAMHFMNGPVVFWDLSRVPKDYREGGHLPFPIAQANRPEVGAGYLSNSGTHSPPTPQRCQSLKGSGEAVL